MIQYNPLIEPPSEALELIIPEGIQDVTFQEEMLLEAALRAYKTSPIRAGEGTDEQWNQALSAYANYGS